MKFKSLLNLAITLLVGQSLFSCSSAKYYEFSPNKPVAYNQVKQKVAVEEVTAPALAEIAIAAAEQKAVAAAAEPVLQASTAKTTVTVPATRAAVAKIAVAAETPATAAELTEAEAMAMAKAKIASMTKAEKREFKKEVKAAMYQSNVSGTSVIEIILAILLPPLAVFLHDGIGNSFWISLILTLLFFIPGIIYALLVVTDTI